MITFLHLRQQLFSISDDNFPSSQTTTATLKIGQRFSELVDNRWDLQSALADNYKLSRLTHANVNGRAFQPLAVVKNDKKRVFKIVICG